MEGEGDIPAPERGAGGSMGKIIAAIVVIILVVAAIAGALLFMGGEAENEKPTAAIDALSSTAAINSAISFDASDSNDTDGTIAEYVWNFGDGTMYTSEEPYTTHYYYVPGFYMIQVIVVDDQGAKASSSVTKVTINPKEITPSNSSAPVASIVTSVDASQYTTQTNTSVTFDGEASYDYTYNESSGTFMANNSAIASYSWVIDGRERFNTTNDSYSFAKAGIHSVILTVTDQDGDIGQTGVSIEVEAQATGPVERQDTFVMATIGEPSTLDPAVDYETAGGEILQNCYETLI